MLVRYDKPEPTTYDSESKQIQNKTTSSGSTPSGNFYTVQKGDTLSGIAKKYGLSWETIYNDNKDLIGSNPNNIMIGQELIIRDPDYVEESKPVVEERQSTYVEEKEEGFMTESLIVNSSNSGIDISKYHSNPDKGFTVTTGNTTYNLSADEIDLLTSIVAAESDQSYDDALAVISVILNRCEAPNWVGSFGSNPVKQATAPNQFVVYQHGAYKSYTGGRAPAEVKTAVLDALAGVRNNGYLSFRSNGSTKYSNNMITSTGNRYK